MDNSKLSKLSQQASMQQGGMPGAELIAQGHAVQRVQTQFVTAIACQIKREKKDVLRRVLEEAELFPEGMVYSWQVNNKRTGRKETIEGPSIKMAMCLAREYGNCHTEAVILEETATHWTLEGRFVDLETGFTCARAFKQRKPKEGKGNYDKDRIEDIEFQVGQSKAIRNAVVNGMSNGFIIQAMNAAKKAEAAQIKKKTAGGGIQDAISKTLKAFTRYDVDIKALEVRLEKPSGKWTHKDIATLRAIWTSLDDGHTTAEQEFDLGAGAREGMNGAFPPAEPEPAEPPDEPPMPDEPPDDMR